MPSSDPEKRREQRRRWYAKNRERMLVYAKEWRDANPDKTREYSRKTSERSRERIRAYNKRWKQENKERPNARRKELRNANPEKYRAQVADWRARNLEKARRLNREYLAAHPELRRKHTAAYRARKRGAKTSEPFDRDEIIRRDGSRCHLCGKKVPPDEVTLDHLVPLVRGGAHSPLNVRVAHARCNSSRGPGRKPAQLILL